MDEAAEEAIDETGSAQEAASAKNAAAQPPTDNGVETLQLDDDELPEDSAAKPPATKKPKSFEPPADKTAKVRAGAKMAASSKSPTLADSATNCDFRWRSAPFILLIIAFILGVVVLPKATISVKTDATNVPVEMNLNLSTTETQLDTSSDTPTVPAKLASEQKTFSQQVPTTGQKNHGNKARAGNVTMTASNMRNGSLMLQMCRPVLDLSANGQNTYTNQQSITS